MLEKAVKAALDARTPVTFIHGNASINAALHETQPTQSALFHS